MAQPITSTSRLRADLHGLAEALDAVRFELPSLEAPRRSAERDMVLRSIRGHLLPRLGDLDAPLLVVLFGSTGSGKSTIVNSLAGREVSTSGAVRPTTREAVVWCHHDHVERLRQSALTDTGPVRFEPDDHPVLRTVTVVDTPDVDSIASEHRIQAESVLALADAVVAVTTPQRYADAVPWEVLGAMTKRRVPILVVANRLTRRSGGAVTDLVGLLRDAGVEGVESTDDVIVIQEQRVRGDGRLPAGAVKRLWEGIAAWGADSSDVIATAVTGGVAEDVAASRRTAAAVQAQTSEGDALVAVVDAAYRDQLDDIRENLAAGDLVRGEVVARWQRMVGVTDLASLVARGVARVRDIFTATSPVAPEAIERVGAEVRDELSDLVRTRIRRAGTTIRLAWELDAAGSELISEVGAATPVEAGIHDAIAGWFDDLHVLVSEGGRTRFQLARAASVGVNATAVLLLMVVLGSTGGLTGAEVGVAAGAAAAQQSLLEHLFGKATAGRLAVQASESLIDRIGGVLQADADRFRSVVEAAVAQPAVVAEIETRCVAVVASLEALS